MLNENEERIFDAVKDFPWHDYGLDVIEELTSDEWAVDLAKYVSSYFGREFSSG